MNPIELSLKELNLLFHDSKNWTLFWRDSMNWIFFVIQRIVLSLLNVIQRIESFLLNVTQRIESLLKNMKNSLIWSKERIEILWYDTKDWIFLIWLTEPNTFNITQRIELFSPIDSKKWTFFSNWLKEVNFFIWQNRTQRFDFFWYDSKNRTLFWIRLKELNTFLTWLKELNFFLQVTQRSELLIWQNMTQRFDFFWYDSKNRTLFWMWLKELNPLHKRTPRIDFLIFSHFFTDLNPFQTRLTELSPFLNNMTHWDWTLLFNMSQRKWLI